MKRLIGFLLALCLCIIQVHDVAAVPCDIESEDKIHGDVTEILNDYQSKMLALRYSGAAESASINQMDMNTEQVLQETKRELTKLGCDVYLVDQYNFTQTEESLQTDLGELGLNRENSYMIVINGAEITPYGTAGPQFTYTYGGKTYTMRYLTVVYGDSESWDNYYQITQVNLLENPTFERLKSFLSTAIKLYLGSKGEGGRTFGTLAGTAISFYNTTTAAKFTMNYTCSSVWTRVYTQVWSAYDQAWTYASSVEYVKIDANVDGYRYNSATNRVEAYNTVVFDTYRYSSHYSDVTWRKQQAAIATASSSPCIKDMTGNVSYHYEYENGWDEVFITHYNNF